MVSGPVDAADTYEQELTREFHSKLIATGFDPDQVEVIEGGAARIAYGGRKFKVDTATRPGEYSITLEPIEPETLCELHEKGQLVDDGGRQTRRGNMNISAKELKAPVKEAMYELGWRFDSDGETKTYDGESRDIGDWVSPLYLAEQLIEQFEMSGYSIGLPDGVVLDEEEQATVRELLSAAEPSTEITALLSRLAGSAHSDLKRRLASMR